MKARMKPYLAIFRQKLLGGLQYRAGFWGTTTTHVVWVYMRVVLVSIFYRYGRGQAGVTLSQAATMIWLQEMALNLMPGFTADNTAWEKISKGDVGYDLVRPLDVYNHWFVSAFSDKLARFLLAIGPVAVFALLTPGEIGLCLSPSPLSLLAGLVTLATGLILSCTVICLCYAAQMDVNVGDAPARVLMIVAQILAGSLLPLQLWPDGMQAFLRLQPFAAMMDLPLRFFAGSAALSELPGVLLGQVIWGVLIWRLGRAWIGLNLRRLVAQGG
ncbi:MAG: hypothetical protein IJ048_00245 [Clostridia bacterium]|nr:hypothetical protein [Clostridia bacterium]